jgi:poly(3-hydroxybutyrate) depolymerase
MINWRNWLLAVLVAGVFGCYIAGNAEADQHNSVVVWLHGRNGTGEKLERLLNFTGTEAVYLTSPDGSWHAGGCCEPAVSNRWDLSDVNRVHREVQRWIGRGYQVYLGGQSNGAGVILRYLCYHDDVQGVISISGRLWDDCTMAEVPIVGVHGGNDIVVDLDMAVGNPVILYPDGGHGARALPDGIADLAWKVLTDA